MGWCELDEPYPGACSKNTNIQFIGKLEKIV